MVWFDQNIKHRGAVMGQAMQVGWRWFRLKLHQLRHKQPQALGDNFPFFPCAGVKVIVRLARLTDR